MKKFFIANKKLSFALLAGILTTAIAVGGIFAWFTATAGVNQGDIDTAEVGVNLPNNGAAYLYEWTYAGLATQRGFIAEIDALSDLADKSAYLGAFWEANDYWGIIGSGIMDLTIAYGMDDPDAEPFKVTPGSIVEYVVRYTNTSNIPVYLRFKAPAISAKKTGLQPAELPAYLYGIVAVTGSGNENVDIVLEDGYYYFTKPLGVTDDVWGTDAWGDESIIVNGNRDAWVNVTAYVDHNLDGYQGGIVDFGGIEAEVIQATNNAPYLAWNTTSVTFEPYVAP